MGKILFFVLFFFLGLVPAHAETAPRSNDLELYALPNLPRELNPPKAALERLKTGAMLIYTQTPKGYYSCSAQFVSRKGHLLTAAHCVRRTKVVGSNEMLMDFLGFRPMESALGKKLGWVTGGRQTPDDAFLERISAGFMDPHGVYRGLNVLKKAKLIAIGKGFTTKYDSWLREKITEEEARERDGLQDFAIVKVADETPSFIPCMKLAKVLPEMNEPVWRAGYGVFGDATLALNLSKGYSLTDQDIDEWSSSADQARRLREDLYRRRQSGLALDMTAVAIGGMSGGPVIDRKGEVVGISISGGSKLGGSALTASFIRQETERLLGKAEARKVFDCQ